MPNLSLCYGTELAFGNPPYTYEELLRIASANERIVRAEEQRPGVYAVPLDDGQCRLWLEDEFRYLTGTSGLQTSDLVDGTTVRTVKTGCSCRGRVVDRNGSPVEGAAVVTIVQLSKEGRGFLQALSAFRVRCAITGPSGRFELNGLPVNTEHGLVFVRPGSAPRRRQMPSTGPRMSYELADTVLDPGGQLLVEVVEDGNGSPIHGASVIARPGPRVPLLDSDDLAAQTDEEGRARLLNLAPGTYSITVQAKAMEPEHRSVRIEDNRSKEVRLRLRAGRAVAGRVVDKDSGVAIARAAVSAQCGGLALPPWPKHRILTDEDGRFVIESAPIGPMTVRVAARGYVSTKEELAAHGSTTEIQLAKEASIVVVARPENGGTCSLYELTIERANARPAVKNVAAEDGRLRVGGILPGDILRLTVDAEAWYGEARCEGVRPGQEIVVSLRAKTLVTGRVSDEDGRPLDGVRIRRVGRQRKFGAATRLLGIMTARTGTRTGADGSFQVRLAPDRSHLLEFVLDGFEPARQEVAPEPGTYVLRVIRRGRILKRAELDVDGNGVDGFDLIIDDR